MNILHVDDEPDILFLAKIALELEEGNTVIQCQSGFEALELLKDCSPDAILLDVMMPGMTGEELFETIKRRGCIAAVPVVFMSARSSPEFIDRLMAAGAAGFIAKPFQPENLAQHIRQMVGGAGALS